ncbi:MAG: Lrp/AsnC family transcriptional regulator [Rubrivivax sp.]
MQESVAESVRLDAIDFRLLRLLQADSGRSNEALAKLAHVSAATSLRRVRRLERTGVIQRRVALIEPARVGPLLQVITEITLDRQGAEHLDAFEARAVAQPAVQQCYRVSPGPDFILVAAVTDMPGWARVVDGLFTQDANVRNVKAYFCVRRAKFEPAFVLLEHGDAGAKAI